MIHRFGHTTIQSIAAFCLAVFIFSFLHSELGQFTSEGDTHESHDFCTLVYDKTSRLNTARMLPVFQPLPLNDLCTPDLTTDCPAFSVPGSILFQRQNSSCRWPSAADRYLFNNVFLI